MFPSIREAKGASIEYCCCYWNWILVGGYFHPSDTTYSNWNHVAFDCCLRFDGEPDWKCCCCSIRAVRSSCWSRTRPSRSSPSDSEPCDSEWAAESSSSNTNSSSRIDCSRCCSLLGSSSGLTWLRICLNHCYLVGWSSSIWDRSYRSSFADHNDCGGSASLCRSQLNKKPVASSWWSSCSSRSWMSVSSHTTNFLIWIAGTVECQ